MQRGGLYHRVAVGIELLLTRVCLHPSRGQRGLPVVDKLKLVQTSIAASVSQRLADTRRSIGNELLSGSADEGVERSQQNC